MKGRLPLRIRWARTLVSLATRLLPRSLRERFGDDPLLYFEDRAGERLRRSGTLGLLVLLAATLTDVLVTAVRARLEARGEARRRSILDEVGQGLRSLLRRPRFAVHAVVPLAVAIAAVTVLVSVTDALLLRPLPYPESDRLVVVGTKMESGVLSGLSVANLLDLRERGIRGMEEVAGVTASGLLVQGATGTEYVTAARPSRGFLEMMGAVPALGRGFAEEEFVEPDVAMISWGWWQERWGGDTRILGQVVETDRGSYRVVGVLPRGWSPPERLGSASGSALWIPLDHADPRHAQTRAFGFATGLGLRAEGVPAEVLEQDLAAAAQELHRTHPEANASRTGGPKVLATSDLRTHVLGGFERRLVLLLAAVGLLLVLTCANVGHLFLARGRDREQELAVRTVLGAGRSRLTLLLASEALGVALLGGALGMLLGVWGRDLIVAFTPGLPLRDLVQMDARVFLMVGAAVLGCTALFGLVPALRSSRLEVGGILRSGGTPGRETKRAHTLLVALQAAVAASLVVGGGLLARNALDLSRVDSGFDAEAVVTFRPVRSSSGSEGDFPALLRRLTERLEATPGIGRVSGSMFVPGAGLPVVVRLDHRTGGGTGVERWRHTVLPGFFETLGIRITEGRSLSDRDVEGASPVVVVSRSLAEELWPDASPVGQTLRYDDGRDPREARVVGVAEDIRNRGPHLGPEPVFYESYLQNPWLDAMSLLVRTDGGAGPGPDDLRRIVHEVAPEVAVTRVSPLTEVAAASTSEERHYALLLGLFSLMALLMAASGVHAVTSYTVARRMREMGIRRAVGAGGERIFSLVLRDATVPVLMGTVSGLAVAFFGAGVIGDLLHGISPTDPATYLTVGGVLLAVAAAAGLGPARRAMKADPVEVLRRG